MQMTNKEKIFNSDRKSETRNNNVDKNFSNSLVIFNHKPLEFFTHWHNNIERNLEKFCSLPLFLLLKGQTLNRF